MIKTQSLKVKSKKVKVKNQSSLFTFYLLLFTSKSRRLRVLALKKSAFIASFLTISLLLSGCVGGKKVPNLDAIFAQSKLRRGKRPVIIIPGILGSELINAETKERVWINLSTAKTDGLSLPISPNLAQNRDSLIATRIIERATISSFLPDVSIYEALIQAVERYGGYAKGDWENPDAGSGGLDKYYVFAYDWRLDNVENARLLTRKIEELKQKLGDADLRFNVIAHSMGGLIARYAAMYGSADLPLADGVKPAPNWSGAANFNKIFMFGVPNEGSMESLALLLKGYRVGGFDINVLNREAAFTAPAVFQLLPHQTTARFYDEDLNLINIDLYNPETWKKYGWSAYADAAFRSKFKGQPNAVASGRKSEFADVSLDDLDAYFANTLKRTKLFHDALDADTTVPASIAFFAFGSDCDPTQDGAILVRNSKTNAWQTIFTPKSYRTSSGRKITKEQTRAKLYAPGDTRVTRRSLLAETITEQNYRNSIFRRNLPVTSTFLCESHDQLPNSKIMQDNFITALVQELTQ
jgi:pimeloyl-ACP methyl ester carboxylesterase